MSLRKAFKQTAAETYVRFSMEDFAKEISDIGHGSLFTPIKGVSFGIENFADDATTAAAAAEVYKQISKLTQKFGIETYIDASKDVASQHAQIDNQRVAATMAALALSDTRSYIKALKRVSVESHDTSDRNVVNVNNTFSGPYGSIQVLGQDAKFGLENYDEKSHRDFRVVTVGYNLAASRQDEFAERIYPTTVINPIEGGVVQVLPYIAVMKDVFHTVSGQRLENQEVNMVEAYRDPSILDDESTDLIPAVDEAGTNVDFFEDALLYAPDTIVSEQGLTFETAPLKAGINLDLIGNSNANALITKGMLDISDTIDPAGRLSSLFVKIEDKLVEFKVDRMERAKFQPDLVGDTRGVKFDFFSDDLVVTKDTKFIDSTVPTVIAELESRKWNVRLGVYFTGHISLSRGDSRFSSGSCSVVSIHDENGNRIDTKSGSGKDVVDAFGAMNISSFRLQTRFTNTNRRQRGHLLQSRSVQFRHAIPMHSPVTLPMSTLDDSTPGEVIKALTVNTNIRNSNNAVKRLLNYVEQLKAVVGEGFDRPQFGAVEGALSISMRPTYAYKHIHLPDVIDSLKSQDRWEDVCSAILNSVKGVLFPAYRESNIEAVFRVVSGNQDERPMFLFAADKEIAN